MKIEIEIKCENDEGERWVRKLVGNRHKIRLITGEVINVVTDKRDAHWFVTDVESGFCMVPPSYYGLLCFDDEHDVFTEKKALETTKFCVDRYLAENNITFAKWRTKRINQLTHQHEDKGE